jgi:hypothetical protein
MNNINLITLSLIILTTLSVWIKKDKKIWMPALALSIVFMIIAQRINIAGLISFLVIWSGFYFFYKKRNPLLFLALVAFVLAFPLKLISGFPKWEITSNFGITFSGICIAFFPLVNQVALAKKKADLKKVAKGLIIGFLGIAILAFVATLVKATTWNWKIPTFFSLRLVSNLFLSCIPQEIIYRGFIQKEIGNFFKSFKWKAPLSILLASIIFTFAHVFWSPNIVITLFVFISSVLYGFVYAKTDKIEASILTHFLLNVVHMLFFKYHAM